MTTDDPTDIAHAGEVVRFWQDAGEKAWFRKDAGFDALFRARFLALHELAAAGRLDHWLSSAEGALALMILLDQFPRNAFRGSPRSFASDARALELAKRAVAAGLDAGVEQSLRLFFYLPFEHAENIDDQKRAVQLIGPLGPELLHYAQIHADVIQRFGRFPHRNAVLGRVSTTEELEFLAAGGFAG